MPLAGLEPAAQEWFAVLHQMRAADLSHKAIAQKLCDEYKIPGWWAQSITVEFERTIGRREVGQTCAGDYQVSVSKTVTGNMDQALKAWKKCVGNAHDFNAVTFANKPRMSKTDKWRIASFGTFRKNPGRISSGGSRRFIVN